jgi:hypothetical protein
MANIDYGVIVIKDGQLYAAGRDKSQGAGKDSKFTSREFGSVKLLFHRECIIFEGCKSKEIEDSTIRPHKLLDDQHKKSTRVKLYDGRNKVTLELKIKKYGCFYVTSFNKNGHHYNVLHGYDIDLKVFSIRQTKRDVKALLRKYLKEKNI